MPSLSPFGRAFFFFPCFYFGGLLAPSVPQFSLCRFLCFPFFCRQCPRNRSFFRLMQVGSVPILYVVLLRFLPFFPVTKRPPGSTFLFLTSNDFLLLLSIAASTSSWSQVQQFYGPFFLRSCPRFPNQPASIRFYIKYWGFVVRPKPEFLSSPMPWPALYMRIAF